MLGGAPGKSLAFTELALSMLKEMVMILDGRLLLVLAGVLGEERFEPSCRCLETAGETRHLKTLPKRRSCPRGMLNSALRRRVPLFSDRLFSRFVRMFLYTCVLFVCLFISSKSSERNRKETVSSNSVFML